MSNHVCGDVFLEYLLSLVDDCALQPVSVYTARSNLHLPTSCSKIKKFVYDFARNAKAKSEREYRLQWVYGCVSRVSVITNLCLSRWLKLNEFFSSSNQQ